MQGRIQIILLIGFTALSVLGNAQNFNDYLRSNEVVLFLRLNHYDTERCNYLLECKTVSLQSDSTEITFRDSKWSVQPTFAASENEGQFNIEIQFECVEGALNDASLSIDLVSQNWSTANYVLMPGSVYNGNRYPFVKSDYPPFVQEFRQLGPNKPILISDQPRLNYKEGASRIQARSGSMSLPSIGYHSQDEEKGIFMWFGQSTPLGDYGVDIEESADRKKAIISLTAPVVREGVQYRGCRLEGKPTDKPANFSKGDRIAIAFKLLFFEHEDVQGLFDQFSKVQETYLHKASISPLMPLSKAYAEIHEKYNRSNWIQKGEQGYYASQTHGDLFQTGWIGGVITLLPLLNGGDALTKERVYQNLEWFFERSETGSNYLPDRIKGGEQATILDYKPIGKLYPLVLARRNAEAAYYLFLLFEELEKKGKSVPGKVRPGGDPERDTRPGDGGRTGGHPRAGRKRKGMRC